MSIVEKAAEKLRTQRPAEQPGLPQVEEVVETPTAPTVERLQEQRHAVRRNAADGDVVHVDLDALMRAGLLPSQDEASGRLSNEVRRAKLPLLNNATGKSAKVPEFADRIVVTSAVPGEGKTFTAINLALSLAREPDFEVVLLDADIPKSDVTRTFGLQGYPGLMDILADESRRTADVILRTDVPNLFLVPAGQRNPLAAELFGGRRMSQVLEDLGANSKQRLLVFDSSPLLATPEARVLCWRTSAPTASSVCSYSIHPPCSRRPRPGCSLRRWAKSWWWWVPDTPAGTSLNRRWRVWVTRSTSG